MPPKRQNKSSDGPAAKVAREMDTVDKARQELDNLLVERNQFKSKLETAVNEVELLKTTASKLEESYNSCIRGLLVGMEAMSKLLTSGKHHLPRSQMNHINKKLDNVLKQTKNLSLKLAEAQIHYRAGTSAEREEIESLLLAQKMLVEEYEQKLLEKEQTYRDLQSDMEHQAETYLKEIEGLKKQIEEIEGNRVDPNYTTCSICLEPWTTSGSHRVSALICGHVFGDICIREHLTNASDCPMCRSLADSIDLRYLFLESSYSED
ncbi:PREDICTED: uncharacterized protein LOC108614473 [Drosophila arizonae]|uniref:Uncharacterized protein LOC108614473 n=1 Tax=Drosophila arizonae TaxID=7263 RepID=A0ABM1PA71_DROAR|nr:PREDICTED: uncharacterized protein LOC108614473 [Drosophila arizonae]